MTLREHINRLNALIKQNPDYANLPVITSADDEGNAFHPVVFEPSAGLVDGHNYTTPAPDGKPNAVCLN